MEKLTLLLIFLLTPLAHSQENDPPCIIHPDNKALYELAMEVDAACGQSIKKIAEEAVLKECESAPKNAGVRLKSTGNPPLRFSDLSMTFDTKIPYYFCKNKLGYESYLSQLVTKLTNEVNGNERKNYREVVNSREPRPAPAAPSEKKRELWSCPVPNYIKTKRIVEASEKATIEGTYNLTCVPFNQ